MRAVFCRKAFKMRHRATSKPAPREPGAPAAALAQKAAARRRGHILLRLYVVDSGIFRGQQAYRNQFISIHKIMRKRPFIFNRQHL
jgi:hypothetical protein